MWLGADERAVFPLHNLAWGQGLDAKGGSAQSIAKGEEVFAEIHAWFEIGRLRQHFRLGGKGKAIIGLDTIERFDAKGVAGEEDAAIAPD